MESNQDKRLSNLEVDELAADAKELLNNPTFKKAVDAVYSRAVGTLLTADIGSLTAQQAHAIMRATAEIKSQLEQYITDAKMRQKYHSEKPHGE